MTIGELLRTVAQTVAPQERPAITGEARALDVTCTGVTHDSRAVMPGMVFVALRGLKTDGAAFVPQAIAAGAAAVVAEQAPAAAAGVPWVVIDRHHTALAELVPDSYVWGDSSAPEVLEAANIREARALVVAIPDWNDAQLAIERALRVHPGLFVAARAPTLDRVQALRALGVAAAVQPEVEGGIEMMRQTLRSLHTDHEAIERLTQDVRERFYATNA